MDLINLIYIIIAVVLAVVIVKFVLKAVKTAVVVGIVLLLLVVGFNFMGSDFMVKVGGTTKTVVGAAYSMIQDNVNLNQTSELNQTISNQTISNLTKQLE